VLYHSWRKSTPSARTTAFIWASADVQVIDSLKDGTELKDNTRSEVAKLLLVQNAGVKPNTKPSEEASHREKV
jgi:hypothetical protein